VALRAARRGFWAALALAWLLSGPAFILAVNLPSDHMGQVLARRFHVLPAAVAVPFVALGVAWLLRVTRARRLVLAGLALVCVALGARAAARSGHQHATLLDAFLREGLLRLPPGAVVVHAADEVLFGMLYLQRVEGVRPDVIAIDSNLLPAAWYRREIARQHPGAAAWIAGLPRHPPDLYAALVAQRPTWLTVASWFRPAEVAGLPGLTPDAGWLRAHPAGTPPPTPDEVAAGLDAAVARLRLTPPDGREEAAWLDSRDAWVPDQLAYSYLIVAEALARGGQGTAAEAIAARGLALAPWVEREQGEAGGR
jgi:hypothetical protein